MTEDIALQQAIATAPGWVRIWITWINIAAVGSFVTFLVCKKTWCDVIAQLPDG